MTKDAWHGRLDSKRKLKQTGSLPSLHSPTRLAVPGSTETKEGAREMKM
eukprot:CAMPEP_0113665370 /NCGR_PEP_ID=MMETSP0038_2-20120614/2266_1 /TAXON_ID=2898 /ORGANISM="Cryptomonas paramecium" /LENGTH=48 /DNA_ID=CAMNT_0000580713 /DNA_START=246 /DNA_END=392 /DNA_ORIENTATION=+ /assembly_acc=CAM_ASM_000170